MFSSSDRADSKHHSSDDIAQTTAHIVKFSSEEEKLILNCKHNLERLAFRMKEVRLNEALPIIFEPIFEFVRSSKIADFSDYAKRRDKLLYPILCWLHGQRVKKPEYTQLMEYICKHPEIFILTIIDKCALPDDTQTLKKINFSFVTCVIVQGQNDKDTSFLVKFFIKYDSKINKILPHPLFIATSKLFPEVIKVLLQHKVAVVEAPHLIFHSVSSFHSEQDKKMWYHCLSLIFDGNGVKNKNVLWSHSANDELIEFLVSKNFNIMVRVRSGIHGMRLVAINGLEDLKSVVALNPVDKEYIQKAIQRGNERRINEAKLARVRELLTASLFSQRHIERGIFTIIEDYLGYENKITSAMRK